MPKNTPSGKIAGGLGVAALAGLAAAGYFFYGRGNKKRRLKFNAWSKKAKIEMAGKIKKMKTISKRAYEQAAAEVLAKYKQAKNIDPKEIAAFGNELKKHWDTIAKQALKLGSQKPSPKKKSKVKRKSAK